MHGRRSGPATPLFPSRLASQDNQLSEAGNGELVAGWTPQDSSDDSYRTAVIATSANGRQWSKPQTPLPRRQARRDRRVWTSRPGPTAAASRCSSTGSCTTPTCSASRSPSAGRSRRSRSEPAARPARRASAAWAPGRPVRPAAWTCGSAPSTPTSTPAAFCASPTRATPTVTPRSPTAGVHVNGLEIRPDTPGAAIVIDTDLHTIDSVGGTVSILLQHPGVPDITLWDGSLHAYLGARDHPGDLLFPLPMSGFTANVLGFDALGTVNVHPRARRLGVDADGAEAARRLRRHRRRHPAGRHGRRPRAQLRCTSTSPTWSSPGSRSPAWRDRLGRAGRAVAGDGRAADAAGGRSVRHGRQGRADHLRSRRLRLRRVHRRPVSGHPDLTATPTWRTSMPRSICPRRAGLTGNAEMGSVAHGDGIYSLEATGPLRTAFGDPVGDDRRRQRLGLRGPADRRPRHLQHRRHVPRDGHARPRRLRDHHRRLAWMPPPRWPRARRAARCNGGFSLRALQRGHRRSPSTTSASGTARAWASARRSTSAGFVFKWNGGGEVHLDGCDSSLSGSGVASARNARAAAGVTVSPGTAVEELDVRGAGGVPSVTLTAPCGQADHPLDDRRPRGGDRAAGRRREPAGARHPPSGRAACGTSPRRPARRRSPRSPRGAAMRR